MLFCVVLNKLVSFNPDKPRGKGHRFSLLSAHLLPANPADQSVQFVPHSFLLNLTPLFPQYLPASPQYFKKALAPQLNRIMSQ